MLPLILVTGRRLPIGRVDHWLEPAVAAPTYYVESVRRGGGLGAVLLPEPLDEPGAAACAEPFAGLVITGGIDVDPALYGQDQHPKTEGVDRLTDDWEIALLQAFLAAHKPVLAICRGHQVLNVALGGTLHQHITEQAGLLEHGIPNGGGGADVDVELEPGSRLDEALGGTKATGRCHHHQAVDRLGDGLVVTARAADGTVEGVELPGDNWVVGVQWHPEDSAERDPQQQALVTAFVTACCA
ncbi:MAG TPA: gamma-glutamyl-gamma-aminobutyrate hydrolase family protein [Acidimicrobiales bacterium]